MLVRHGHTYSAAADLPFMGLLPMVRSELVRAGFVDVSVRAVDGPNYNAIGRGTWTGPDQDVELPSAVVWVHDVTPADVAPPPPEALEPARPVPIPAGPAPSVPLPPTAPTTRRRRRAPREAAFDPSVTVVSGIVAGIGALVLWKLKRDGFWERRAWR